MGKSSKPRIIFAILGMDVHTRATTFICQAFRDAGMEVIYLGFGSTPEMVVEAAVSEDADLIALSTHCGYHMMLFPKLMQLLREKQLDIPVVAGGTIQEAEKPLLEKMGITGNFTGGTSLDVMVNHVTQEITRRKKS